MSHALQHPGEHYTVESHRSSHHVAYETARSDLMDLAKRGFLEKEKTRMAWVFRPPTDLKNRLRRTQAKWGRSGDGAPVVPSK
jgi:hypothetical protein